MVSTMPMIRVAFLLGDVGWTGGLNYYKNLLLAIKGNPNPKVQPVLFFGLKADVSEFEGLGEIVRSSMFDKYAPLWFASKIMKKIGRDYCLFRLLKAHHILVLSHVGWLWKSCSIPSLGWIPDFQHLHLKQFFTEKELVGRNRGFSLQVEKSSAILLSSQNALNDLKTFSPNVIHTYILRFKSCMSQECLESKEALEKKYNINRPWFYIPNQFWQHKNHTVVLEALKMMKKLEGTCPLVLCSGETSDERNSSYFPLLSKKIKDWGLESDFIVLGKVPYVDVTPLMKYSMAVINPSLFEGWNTAVEEAKAMGKAVIISDIEVHKEQNPERGYYFVSSDEKSLSEAMRKVADAFDEHEEQMYQEKAESKRSENIMSFASEYEEIIIDILEGNK